MTRQVPYPHPGEILAEEFLMPMGITPYKLAQATHMPLTRIMAILSGERAITADTGLRLARAFGTSDAFWMNLQRDFDAATARDSLAEDLDQVLPLYFRVDVLNADGASVKQLEAAKKKFIVVFSGELGGTAKVPAYFFAWSKCLREGSTALSEIEVRQVKALEKAKSHAEASASLLLEKVKEPSFLLTLTDGSAPTGASLHH